MPLRFMPVKFNGMVYLAHGETVCVSVRSPRHLEIARLRWNTLPKIYPLGEMRGSGSVYACSCLWSMVIEFTGRLCS